VPQEIVVAVAVAVAAKSAKCGESVPELASEGVGNFKRHLLGLACWRIMTRLPSLN